MWLGYRTGGQRDVILTYKMFQQMAGRNILSLVLPGLKPKGGGVTSGRSGALKVSKLDLSAATPELGTSVR